MIVNSQNFMKIKKVINLGEQKQQIICDIIKKHIIKTGRNYFFKAKKVKNNVLKEFVKNLEYDNLIIFL